MIKNKVVAAMFLLLLINFTNAEETTKKEHFKKLPNGEFIFAKGDLANAEILYFFNYNCPSCSVFTPEITNWSDSLNPSEISFKFIPVQTTQNSKWAALSHFIIKQHNDSVKPHETTNRLWENNSIIDTPYAAAAMISDSTKLTYEDALEELLSDKYSYYLAKSNALFNDFQAEGTPNIGVTMSNGNRYIIGPQHGNSYQEMISVLSGLIEYNNP